ncbi:MAG: hypothetical protein AAF483_04450 [Planctomycetota bacterium]
MATFQDGQPQDFVDRRSVGSGNAPGVERRQFTNSHSSLSPDARELAEAIDAYKIQNRRRYITFEEMLQVIQELGYEKQAATV